MNHWQVKLGDRFYTRDSTITEVVQLEVDGYFMCDNGFWYDERSGRDGWCVRGIDFPHDQDLREKVK